MCAGAAPLHLDEIGGGENGPEHAEVEDIGTVVARGHHADGDADAGLTGLVAGDEVGRAKQIVVGEIDRELLGVWYLGSDLHSEIRLVFFGKHAVGHLVEDLGQLGGVVLADCEEDGFADLTTYRVPESVFEEGLAEDLVGGFREEASLELALPIGLFVVLAVVIGERYDEALFGEEFGSNFGARVHHCWIDEETVSYPVDQRVAKGRLPALAAEGPVGVHEKAAFGLAWVPCPGFVGVEALQIVARCCGESEFVTNEIIEHGAGVATDGTVGLVGDHQVEVSWREQPLVFVVEEKGLDGGDDDFGASPVVQFLLVDNGLEVGGEETGEGFIGLILQFEAVHQKKDAAGIAGAQEQFDDGSGGDSLTCTGGHFEEEAIPSVLDGSLQGLEGLELVVAKETQIVGLNEPGPLGFVFPGRLGGVIGPLGQCEIVGADWLPDQARRVGRDLMVSGYGIRRRECGDDVGIAAFEVPEIMQVSVGEDDEPAIQGAGVLAGLFLAHQWILFFGLGFQNDEGETLGVEQEEIDEAFFGLFEVMAQSVEVGLFDGDARFELDIGGLVSLREEPPTARFEEFVYF